MNKKKFISEYIKNFCEVIKSGESQTNQLINVINLIKKSNLIIQFIYLVMEEALV